MYTDYFIEYPEEPTEMTVSNAIARLIDGLGFRLHWALYGLKEEDCGYRISEDSKTIKEILWHIFGLVNWVYMHIYGHQMKRPKSIIEQGYETLRVLELLRKRFIEMDDEELSEYKLEDMSFWSYINMPLSDAISHVGQVSIMRRGAGNPNRVNEYFKNKKATK